MTLTFPNNGATATTASEATVNEITSDDDAYWGAMVFVPATFTSTDSMEIKFYTYDINAATITGKVQYFKSITGDQSQSPAFYIPITPCKRYRLTFKRTVGTDRTFTWHIIKQTG
jgi:hypothetical protein